MSYLVNVLTPVHVLPEMLPSVERVCVQPLLQSGEIFVDFFRGEDALKEYMETKTVSVDYIEDKIRRNRSQNLGNQ